MQVLSYSSMEKTFHCDARNKCFSNEHHLYTPACLGLLWKDVATCICDVYVTVEQGKRTKEIERLVVYHGTTPNP